MHFNNEIWGIIGRAAPSHMSCNFLSPLDIYRIVQPSQQFILCSITRLTSLHLQAIISVIKLCMVNLCSSSKSGQTLDFWHAMTKQYLIVTDFPDGHSLNVWRSTISLAISFHFTGVSRTSFFSSPLKLIHAEVAAAVIFFGAWKK